MKPALLRKKITEFIPLFAQNPEKLQLYYANGTIHTTSRKALGKSLSFEKTYTLEIYATDIAINPDLLFLCVSEFVQEQQQEIGLNHEAIKFEVEPLNDDSYDIVIHLPITEDVIVKKENDQYQLTYNPALNTERFTEQLEPVFYPYKKG